MEDRSASAGRPRRGEGSAAPAAGTSEDPETSLPGEVRPQVPPAREEAGSFDPGGPRAERSVPGAARVGWRNAGTTARSRRPSDLRIRERWLESAAVGRRGVNPRLCFRCKRVVLGTDAAAGPTGLRLGGPPRLLCPPAGRFGGLSRRQCPGFPVWGSRSTASLPATGCSLDLRVRWDRPPGPQACGVAVRAGEHGSARVALRGTSGGAGHGPRGPVAATG